MNRPSMRWSALALLAGGLLMAIGAAIHPDDAAADAVVQPMWGPAHWLLTVAALLLLYGLTDLYMRWLTGHGTTGLAAYLAIFTGMALLLSIALIEAAVVAPLAARPEAAPLLAMDGPIFAGPLGTVFLLTIVLLTLGSLAVGWLLYSGRHVPAAAAALVGIGGAVLSLSQWLPYVFDVASGLALGAGLAWLGWIAWQQEAAPAMG